MTLTFSGSYWFFSKFGLGGSNFPIWGIPGGLGIPGTPGAGLPVNGIPKLLGAFGIPGGKGIPGGFPMFSFGAKGTFYHYSNYYFI